MFRASESKKPFVVLQQITINADLLEQVAKLPDLPPDLAKQIALELGESDNTARERRRLYMRLDAIDGISHDPKTWPETMTQVSGHFRNLTGADLYEAIAYSLEWISGTSWVTRSARLALVDAAAEKRAQLALSEA